jgi:Mitochondrial ATP synthase B chain precursor (ATP-synt_B)
MLNYFLLIILLSLVLIAQNIILLNEETLILVCFITFCYLAVKNLSTSFKTNLDIRSNKIEVTLKNSLKQTSYTLNNTLNIQNRFWIVFNEFKSLGNNCLDVINVITDWSLRNSIKETRIPFPKRLQFISRVENQAAQLITLLIIRKLKKTTSLKTFCSSKLVNPHFVCLDKVNIREYIQSIVKN